MGSPYNLIRVPSAGKQQQDVICTDSAACPFRFWNAPGPLDYPPEGLLLHQGLLDNCTTSVELRSSLRCYNLQDSLETYCSQLELLRQPAVAQGAPNSRAAGKGSRSQSRHQWGGGWGDKGRKMHNTTLQRLQPYKNVIACISVQKCQVNCAAYKMDRFCCCSLNQFLREQTQRTGQSNYKGMWYFWLVLVPRNLYLCSRVPWAHKLFSEAALYIQYTRMVEVFNILPPQNKNASPLPMTVNR